MHAQVPAGTSNPYTDPPEAKVAASLATLRNIVK